MNKHYDYSVIEAGYYDAVFRKASGMQSKWHHLKLKFLREEMPSAYSSHLDIGCGPGTFIGTLDAEKESYGVDIAANQIRYAQDHYGTKTHHFECIENGTLPFEEGKFDVVTIIDVLELIANEERSVMLLEARRVLRPVDVLSYLPLIIVACGRFSKSLSTVAAASITRSNTSPIITESVSEMR